MTIVPGPVSGAVSAASGSPGP